MKNIFLLSKSASSLLRNDRYLFYALLVYMNGIHWQAIFFLFSVPPNTGNRSEAATYMTVSCHRRVCCCHFTNFLFLNNALLLLFSFPHSVAMNKRVDRQALAPRTNSSKRNDTALSLNEWNMEYNLLQAPEAPEDDTQQQKLFVRVCVYSFSSILTIYWQLLI